MKLHVETIVNLQRGRSLLDSENPNSSKLRVRLRYFAGFRHVWLMGCRRDFRFHGDSEHAGKGYQKL